MLAFQEGFCCMELVNPDIKLWDMLDTALVKE